MGKMRTATEMWRLPSADLTGFRAFVKSVTIDNPNWTGFPNRSGATTLEDHRTDDPVKAYVSHGRWVAVCPICSGGMPTKPGVPVTVCLDCGTIWTVSYPDAEKIRKAERVLELRRGSDTMNWFPDREEPEDLQVENATRGEPFT